MARADGIRFPRCLRIAAVVVAGAGVSGCAGLISSMAADTLSAAVLNQTDPQLVASGLPAYLLLVDGLISQHPDDENLLAAGGQLFSLYGSRFAPSPEQSVALTAKGRRYGARSICLVQAEACDWDGLGYDEFVSQLQDIDKSEIDYLYAYAIGWLSYLDATSTDWNAVAELPWVEAALDRALALDETYDHGAIHGYLGILNALRPPALGGHPELAKAHFERAIELSGGRDLSIKVEYARRYARLIFDQELHDRLLEDVIASPTEAPGYTLFNTLAKQEAQDLLDSSAEYF